MNTSYPAKILLFGEYAVIAGGSGLAIPEFSCSLQWNKESADKIYDLLPFCLYLKEHELLSTLINTKNFEADINKGETIISNIPIGYGIGSSGALVAAVYDRYAISPLHKNPIIDFTALRYHLAQMENFFHSNSSGLDPLISLIQKPIFLKENGEVEVVEDLRFSENYIIELVDTKIPRQTSSIVNLFTQKLTEDGFRNSIQNEYLPLVSNCIKYTIENNVGLLHQAIIELSDFQLRHFDFAIPETSRSEWEDALINKKYYYKLCGAGGGGFLLKLTSISAQ